MDSAATPSDSHQQHQLTTATSGTVGLGSTLLASLACALSAPRSVTIVVLNSAGFHRAVHQRRPEEVVAAMDTAASVIAAEARRAGGVVAVFHGDHFIVTFNAVKPGAHHARRACLFAWRVVTASRGEGENPQTASAPSSHGNLCNLLSYRAGVSTGRCLVGNLGSSAIKAFATVGPAVTQAIFLERHTRHVAAGDGTVAVLAAERTVDDIEPGVRAVAVDVALLPHIGKPQSVFAVLGPATAAENDAKTAAPQPPPVGGSPSEWIYSPSANDENGAVDAGSLINEAYRAFADGRFDDAAVLSARTSELFARGGSSSTVPLHLDGHGLTPTAMSLPGTTPPTTAGQKNPSDAVVAVALERLDTLIQEALAPGLL